MTGLWARKTGPSSELTSLRAADARTLFLARDALLVARSAEPLVV
jgi:hypothetical protein